MSWIAKAENLLNKIDQSAANVLQQKEETTPAVIPVVNFHQALPKVPSSKNILVLTKATPKKTLKNDLEERWETMSETNISRSRRSSFSSKHGTVIDKSEDQKSSSNASLNSFSIEKELAATKILVSELRSENNELKGELESVMEQVKINGNSEKLHELESYCAVLSEEKKDLTAV